MLKTNSLKVLCKATAVATTLITWADEFNYQKLDKQKTYIIVTGEMVDKFRSLIYR